jgi:transposase InsO family protein
MTHPRSNETTLLRSPERWAHLRFSIVGPLLAAPPQRGALQAQIKQLSAQKWRHPITGVWMQFGGSTIERWYYAALREKIDPVKALRRKTRSDQGKHPGVSAELAQQLCVQHKEHPQWSYQLHADNLAAVVEKQPELGVCPSYACLVRFMKSRGLFKRARRGPAHSPGAREAEERFERREVRSYESEYVNALWHVDFHHGSLRVLLDDGTWAHPILLGTLDDKSRLCCHAQWYLSEGAEEFCHGLGQALQKRSLPRALMSDNGSAMLSTETEQGLARLGIVHETTLPYSPYQNGKQESFWGNIEGRLLPMLEGVADLRLGGLNEATQAWVEMEYNRKLHRELGQSPAQCFGAGKDVGRPCPASEQIALAFTAELRRQQRRSDGTISLHGVRLEIPSRYRHFEWVSVRVAAWDLSRVHLSDPATGTLLCRLYPLDKQKNADARRAAKPSLSGPAPAAPTPGGVAPLLAQLIAQYARTGLPPAYLPKDEITLPTP